VGLVKTFSQIVREVLDANRVGNVVAKELAADLTAALHREGYAIHEARRCVRVPAQPPGRPMTQDEMITLGLSQLAVDGD
jgi:hypothetical protein